MEALDFAKKGLKIDEACLGTDHSSYLERVRVVEALEQVEKMNRKKDLS
jgi:hypothetical protein